MHACARQTVGEMVGRGRDNEGQASLHCRDEDPGNTCPIEGVEWPERTRIPGMTLTFAVQALAASGPLASRAFAPLLVVLLLAANPWIYEHIPYATAPTLPEQVQWMVEWPFLLLIGSLAALELAADKFDEAKMVLDRLLAFVKPCVAVLLPLGLMPAEVVATMPVLTEAGLGAVGALLIGAAVLTFTLAQARTALLDWLSDLDEDDDLGLRLAISFLEDFWAIVAVLVVVAFPLLALASVVLLFAGWYAMRRLRKHLEDRRRIEHECGELVLPAASSCLRCAAPVQARERWDFGVLSSRMATSLELGPDAAHIHGLALLSEGRCPRCAEEHGIDTLLDGACPSCSSMAPQELGPGWFRSYRREVVFRGLKLLLPVTLAGLIPGFGVAVGILLGKVFVVAPLRRFLGSGWRVGLKWTMRLVTMGFAVLGSLPLLSVIFVPLLLGIYLLVYGWAAGRAVRRGPLAELALAG